MLLSFYAIQQKKWVSPSNLSFTLRRAKIYSTCHPDDLKVYWIWKENMPYSVLLSFKRTNFRKSRRSYRYIYDGELNRVEELNQQQRDIWRSPRRGDLNIRKQYKESSSTRLTILTATQWACAFGDIFRIVSDKRSSIDKQMIIICRTLWTVTWNDIIVCKLERNSWNT